MNDSDTFAASDAVVSREIGGELVLLDLAGGEYFGLNAVGGAVWQELEAAPRTLAGLTDAIVRTFEVDAHTARADIAALLSDLLAQGLVTLHQGSAANLA